LRVASKSSSCCDIVFVVAMVVYLAHHCNEWEWFNYVVCVVF